MATLPFPKALLLDLDDTILNYSGGTERCWRDACVACVPESGDIEPGTLLEAIERTREWFWADAERHRRGRFDLDTAAREVVTLSLAELGTTDSTLAGEIAARYRAQRDAGFELFPDAIETVQWLRQQGCRLALVTNGSAAAQRGKMTRFGLTPLFDSVLIEEEVGCGKPDPRIYTRALHELGAAATDSWMIGDHLEFDVAQPQKMGLRGIWIDVQGTGVPKAHAVRPDRILRRLSELRTWI